MATIFNATEYLALYPELAQFGLNADNVYAAHYVPYGAAELRAPNNELAGKIYPASVLAYANGNPELAEAFGVTAPATELTATQQADLVLHYVNYGNAEDRADKLVDAPVQEEDVPVTDLVEALVAYQNAEAALATSIEDAAKALDIDPEVADIAEAVEDAVNEAADAVEAAGVAGFADATPAVQKALLAATQQQLTAQLEIAKLGLTAQEQGRVIQFDKAKDGLETAAFAMVDANQQALTTASKVAASNSDATATPALVTTVVFTNTVADGAKITVTIGSDDPVDLKVVQGKVVGATAEVKALDGYSSLEDTLTNVAAKAKALDTAAEKMEAAGTAIAKLEGVDPFDPASVTAVVAAAKDSTKSYSDVSTAVDGVEYEGAAFVAKTTVLNNALDDLSAFEKAVDAYQTAVSEEIKLLAAIESSVEAKEYLVEEFGVHPLIVNVSALSATREDDLFVYAEEQKTAEVFGFNEVGEDLFFFGSQFTWTVLEAGADITKAGNGDRDVLEILALQDGSDLVLYVETDAAGGTVIGQSNIDTIKLSGVNLEDVDFSAGFLTGVVA